jgi:hypothetical protein
MVDAVSNTPVAHHVGKGNLLRVTAKVSKLCGPLDSTNLQAKMALCFDFEIAKNRQKLGLGVNGALKEHVRKLINQDEKPCDPPDPRDGNGGDKVEMDALKRPGGRPGAGEASESLPHFGTHACLARSVAMPQTTLGAKNSSKAGGQLGVFPADVAEPAMDQLGHGNGANMGVGNVLSSNVRVAANGGSASFGEKEGLRRGGGSIDIGWDRV